ncbi:MAG: alkaline phosphatase family protein [Planctomycetota bacterium]
MRVVLLLLPFWFAACSAKRAAPHAPVLLFGADGVEWSVARPLLDAGRMPHLKSLIERGNAGLLRTYGEHGGGTRSPVIWTTIATGKSPRDHGIFDFLDKEGHPYSSNARRGKALWNIASDYDLVTHVSGWWITWPAEAINGCMISAATSHAQQAAVWKGTVLPNVQDQFHPAALERELAPLVADVFDSEVVRARLLDRVFGADRDALPAQVLALMRESLWSLLADELYVRAARRVIEQRTPDLAMVYVGSTDVIGHRFFGYLDPSQFAYPLPGAQHPGLRDALGRTYELMDEWLGMVLAAMPADTRVIVVSDHGMHAAFTRAPDPNGKTGEHQDGPPGVIVVAGRDLAHVPASLTQLATLGTVEDVAPTVLALLGIPAGEDMAGRVLDGLFDPAARLALAPVPTHDTGFRPPSRARIDAAVEEGFKERYGALGYFGVSRPKPR